MELGERVYALRCKLGLSQEELASKMGYKSRSSINKIEKGRPCSQKIIMKLAECLNTTPMYLMGWEEEKPILVEDELDDKISEGYDLLSNEDKEKVSDFILFLLSQKSRRE